MSKASDRDVETLLHSAAFSNPAHKEALRSRLFGDRQALALDDLALAEGGELIDIRPQHRRLAEGPIPCTAAVDPEELDDYLQNKDPDTRLFFICSFGTVADQATWHAYLLGFHNARSVGGWHRGLHID